MNEYRDFDTWLSFFKNNKGDLSLLIDLIKDCDNYFLTNSFDVDFEHEYYEYIYPCGFTEIDFQKIDLEKEEVINKEERKDLFYYETRISIYIHNDINLEKLKEKFGENKFKKIIEQSLIKGFYEDYEIPFEKLLSKSIKNNYLKKDDIFDVSFLRGLELGSRE